MNRGQVVLDVIARGSDEVSAMLRKVGEQAKSTEKQLDSMSTSASQVGRTTDTGGLVNGIKKVDGAIEGAAQGIEKFNKILGVAGFIGVALAAGPVVVAFVKDLFSIESSSDRARIAVAKFNELLQQSQKDFAAIQFERLDEQGKRAVKLQEQIVTLQEKAAEMNRQSIELESQIGPLFKQREELLARYVKETEYRNELIGQEEENVIAVQIAEMHKQRTLGDISKTQAQINELIYSQGEASRVVAQYSDEILFLERERADAILGSYAAMFKFIGLQDQVPKAFGLAPISLPEPKIPPGGGGRGRRTNELEELMRLGEEKTRQRLEDDEAMRLHWEKMAAAEKAAEDARIKASEARIKAEEEMALMREIDAFKPLADDVANATAAMLTFGDAVGEAAGAFPDLSDALSETMGIWSDYGDRVAAIQKLVADGTKTSAEATVMAEDEKTNAIIAGTTAGLAAVGKLIGGLRAEYAIRAAGELAAGFATLGKPDGGVESAGHFIAAGLYAVAAGTSPPSGGGGARGSSAAGTETDMGGGSTSASTVDREPRTIVYNFSTLVADRQQVGRAIRDSELASERNGYGRRRGV